MVYSRRDQFATSQFAIFNFHLLVNSRLLSNQSRESIKFSKMEISDLQSNSRTCLEFCQDAKSPGTQ